VKHRLHDLGESGRVAGDLSALDGVRFLGRFLSLVGLGALLLGGVGVASAIHVYIREKRPGIAVLRCLGAGQATAFVAYLIQAALLGLVGAAAGVVLGVAVQALLPVVLADVLPVDVSTRLSLGSAAAGLVIGIWVAVIFALIPLLQARDVPPLAALRQDFDRSPGWLDPFRLVAYALLVGSVIALCIIEAPEPEMGLAFAGALAAATALIAGTGWLMTRAARLWFPARASYPVRQGGTAPPRSARGSRRCRGWRRRPVPGNRRRCRRRCRGTPSTLHTDQRSAPSRS
jgi:putative ABC transport system permease protein